MHETQPEKKTNVILHLIKKKNLFDWLLDYWYWIMFQYCEWSIDDLIWVKMLQNNRSNPRKLIVDERKVISIDSIDDDNISINLYETQRKLIFLMEMILVEKFYLSVTKRVWIDPLIFWRDWYNSNNFIWNNCKSLFQIGRFSIIFTKKKEELRKEIFDWQRDYLNDFFIGIWRNNNTENTFQ